MNYLVGDLVTRIKNAASANRRELNLAYSKLNHAISNVLVREGYLKSVAVEETDGKKILKAEVAYQRRLPVLTSIEIVSKPSLRIYISVAEVARKGKRGHKTMILSTNKGVMTGKEAQKEGLGGELLFQIQ